MTEINLYFRQKTINKSKLQNAVKNNTELNAILLFVLFVKLLSAKETPSSLTDTVLLSRKHFLSCGARTYSCSFYYYYCCLYKYY